MIEEMEIDVLHAESLAEAVRKIDAADAVILDLLLPDASDARTNQVFAELTRLPIIVHTASPGSQAEKLAERIGAQIVRKDQPAEVLQAAVRKVMGE